MTVLDPMRYWYMLKAVWNVLAFFPQSVHYFLVSLAVGMLSSVRATWRDIKGFLRDRLCKSVSIHISTDVVILI